MPMTTIEKRRVDKYVRKRSDGKSAVNGCVNKTIVLLVAMLGGPVSAWAADSSGFMINPGMGFLNYDRELDLDDAAMGELGLEYRFSENYAIEGSYQQSNPDFDEGPGDLDFKHLRLDGLYYFREKDKWHPYVAMGVGDARYEIGGADDLDETIVNIGGGTRYYFTPELSLRGDLRLLNSVDEETTSYSGVISISYLFAGDRRSTVERSTPDLAVTEEKVKPVIDTDKDGLADNEDKCPNTPLDVAVDEVGCAIDTDRDGIADYNDQCAMTPTEAEVDLRGCALDSDQDGIADYKDRCRDTPLGFIINEEGCVMTEKEQLALQKEVRFEPNSSILEDRSANELRRVVELMQKYKNTELILEGHTDSTGNDAYNKMLSGQRAEKVREMLVKRFNIAKERIKTIAVGEEQPIADNKTPEGRHKNRRVVAAIRNMPQ